MKWWLDNRLWIVAAIFGFCMMILGLLIGDSFKQCPGCPENQVVTIKIPAGGRIEKIYQFDPETEEALLTSIEIKYDHRYLPYSSWHKSGDDSIWYPDGYYPDIGWIKPYSPE